MSAASRVSAGRRRAGVALRHLATASALLLTLVWSGRAAAYQIGSIVTSPCHEQMSVRSYALLLAQRPDALDDISLPESNDWEPVAEYLLSTLDLSDDEVALLTETRERLFVAFSLHVGARRPDTQGFSVTDANAIRRVHGIPTAERQHEHTLRAELDEGPEGELAVLAGARETLDDYLRAGAMAWNDPGAAIVVDQLSLDFYGRLELPVWAPAWNAGQALHTLQDSYSHTVRTEDGREVLTVFNYTAAAAGSLEEERDGLAHSKTMDDCQDPGVQPLVERAVQSGASLLLAQAELARGQEQALLDGLAPCSATVDNELDCGWIVYSAECEAELLNGQLPSDSCCSLTSEFCDASILPLVRENPTSPVISCQQQPQRRLRSSWLWLLAGVLILLARRRQQIALCFLLASAASLSPRLALADEPSSAQQHAATTTAPGKSRAETTAPAAQPPESEQLNYFVGLEFQLSLLADNSRGAMADLTFGPGLRGGALFPRRGKPVQWGVFGVLSQESWLRTEYDGQLESGVLNLGVGGELRFWQQLRASLSLGPSFLLFDAILHQPPQVGLFVDARPLGLVFPLGPQLELTLDPLGAVWSAPVLSSPSIAWVSYRITVGLNWLSRGPASSRDKRSGAF